MDDNSRRQWEYHMGRARDLLMAIVVHGKLIDNHGEYYTAARKHMTEAGKLRRKKNGATAAKNIGRTEEDQRAGGKSDGNSDGSTE